MCSQLCIIILSKHQTKLNCYCVNLNLLLHLRTPPHSLEGMKTSVASVKCHQWKTSSCVVCVCVCVCVVCVCVCVCTFVVHKESPTFWVLHCQLQCCLFLIITDVFASSFNEEDSMELLHLVGFSVMIHCNSVHISSTALNGAL